MDINELESFKLSDAVAFHKELNPKLWEDNQLDPEVRDQLLLIAEDFVEYLGISNLKVKDVTISGSNAAYSYTPHSDLDLHVLVDFNELPNNEVYQELFTAKKTLYNDAHDITVRDVPVELYVQDTNNPVQSLGEYSIVHDKWIRIPKKRRANFDEVATKAKYEKLGDLIELAIKSKDPKRVNDTIALVKRYRKSGLDKAGEFGPENLAYKAVRKQGLVQALHDLKAELHGEKLSIEEDADQQAATLKIQKHLNKKYGANLDLDGKLGPLTLKSINKFMPKAKTGLADEPNKTTAVQGKKLKEAPRTLQSQVTPLEKLVQDYGYLTTFGMSHLDKQGATPEAQQQLLALVQRMSKDGKTFANLDKQKMESNRDAILKHIHSMMQYAIPVLKKNLPTDKWEAKRSQINSVLTAYNDARQINEAAGTNLVYRVDKTKIPNFDKNLKTYYHNDDWSMSGSEWEGATGSAKGLYAHPDKLFVALYAAGTPETNRYVATYNTSPPMVYFDKKDVPKFKNTKSYLTAFDASTFKKVPSGEVFSDMPGKPVHQIEITDPFKFIKQQGWGIKLVDDLPAKLKEIKKIAKEKNIKYGAEGMDMDLHEASGYIPSEKEKNDPRFKTALTVDVRPDAIKKNAKAFGFKISRAGIPPQARADGKIAEDLMREFNAFLAEDQQQINISVTKGKNKFATQMTVAGEQAGVYQYDGNTGRSIAEVYPEFKGKGLGKILVLHAIYTANISGIDFVEDESRTTEYDNVLDSLDSNSYIVNDDDYWYVTDQGEQFLKKTLSKGLSEQQEEMFPGYDEQHREKRLGNWLAKSWGVQNGKPQTFYHATTKDFDTFNTSGTGFASALGMAYEVERHGSFFAVDPKFAEGFIEDPNTGRVKEGGRVLPVHLSIQSPIDLRDNALSRMVSDEETADEFKANGIDLRSVYNHFYELERWELFDGPEGAEFIDNLQKLGFDGAIINESIPNDSNAKSGQVWVAFSPNQVKSVHNRGSFSPDDARLTKESG